ncbi:MAG TPA: hypothetical protein VMT93_04175 [Gemmatimonadaceae bacterium]|nr:hypothetical protein [Gemmatimonadaceae bacterium]
MRPDRLAILALLLPAALAAQAGAPQAGAATVTAATEFRLAPDGRVLAQLRPGAGVRTVTQSGGWTQVVLDGWLHVSVIGPRKDSFALTVKSPNGALMRATADRNGAVVAQLEDGMGLMQSQRTEQWAHVQRTGWVLSKTLKAGAPPAATVAAAKPAPPPAGAKPAPTSATTAPGTPPSAAPAGAASAAAAPPPVPPESLPGDVMVGHATPILTAPSGVALGSLDSATRLTTGPAERGWVKVTLEGWVRQADLVPLDSNALSSVSAADLRAQPDKYRGTTVRWQVQVIAYQTADPLRKDLGTDEPYLLARGPGAENSLLYLALPPSLMQQGKTLKPMSSIVIIARVRSGKSDPSGVPVLDVQRIVLR